MIMYVLGEEVADFEKALRKALDKNIQIFEADCRPSRDQAKAYARLEMETNKAIKPGLTVVSTHDDERTVNIVLPESAAARLNVFLQNGKLRAMIKVSGE